MGYVLMTRNPKNGRLVAIVDDDHGNLAEFGTEAEAADAADHTTLCKAWGYEIVEVDR
jgi:hypothetical protein